MFLSSTALLSLGTLLAPHFTSLVGAGGNPSFNYGVDKVYGVNIGGWLVIEPWITPSLFDKTGNPDIVDEWTFAELQNNETAAAALREHWETFYTEDDFKQIADAGLNHVRIPIGYWAFEVADDEPYISGQLPYLQKALAWCEKYGLKALIDLHGAPGSQNGYDNSGQRLDYPTWHTKQENIDRTNAVLKTIADMFTPNSTVAPIIAPLNEPAGWNGTDLLNVLRAYWLTSYDSIRHPSFTDDESDTVVLLYDAYQDYAYWGDFMATPDYTGVAMDTHPYQIFTFDLISMTPDEHIEFACNFTQTIKNFTLPMVIGEWAPAITDCARYLNGRGKNARYDGTYPGSTFQGFCVGKSGDASFFSDEYKEYLRKYWEAQAAAYETSWGWFQWAWKTEAGTGEEWSYQKGLEYGWIPQTVTDRQYPGICDGY